MCIDDACLGKARGPGLRARGSAVIARHSPDLILASSVLARAISRATAAAVSGNVSGLHTVALAGQLIETIGGRSSASMSSTTSRSEPLIVLAAGSVRLCTGISLS